LPKGELRSKVNKKAAIKQRPKRSPGQAARILVGIVYFIQDTITLGVKIGFCLSKPEKRLAALQTGNSSLLRLFGHIGGSSLHEKLLHKRFSEFHLDGEWFSNAIIATVEDIVKCNSLDEWLKAQECITLEQSVKL
jgi:hypothetical protein